MDKFQLTNICAKKNLHIITAPPLSYNKSITVTIFLGWGLDIVGLFCVTSREIYLEIRGNLWCYWYLLCC